MVIISEVVSGFSFIVVVHVDVVVVEVVVCRFVMCVVLQVRVRLQLRIATWSFTVSYRWRVVMFRSLDVVEREMRW